MEDVMSTYKGIVVVKSQEKIATDVYSMVLECEEAAKQAKPGQFICLYTYYHNNLDNHQIYLLTQVRK